MPKSTVLDLPPEEQAAILAALRRAASQRQSAPGRAVAMMAGGACTSPAAVPDRPVPRRPQVRHQACGGGCLAPWWTSLPGRKGTPDQRP
jgi:hypothetical protein